MLSLLSASPLVMLMILAGAGLVLGGIVSTVRGSVHGIEVAVLGVMTTVLGAGMGGVAHMREKAAQVQAQSAEKLTELRKAAEEAGVPAAGEPAGKGSAPDVTSATDAAVQTPPSGSAGGGLPSAADVLPWALAFFLIALLILAGVAGVTWAYRARGARRIERDAATAAAAAAAAEEQARLDRVWGEAEARHDRLREEMLRHQSDIDLVLSMPLINDHSEPKTAAFVTALGKAADLAHDVRPSTAEAVEAYAHATRAADLAWGVAWRHADRVRLSKFAPEERAIIKKVAKLMGLAEGGATAEERRTYYQGAMKMLDNLIDIPKPAAEAIEMRVAGVLANPNALPVAESETDGSELLESPVRRILDFGRAAWRRAAA